VLVVFGLSVKSITIGSFCFNEAGSTDFLNTSLAYCCLAGCASDLVYEGSFKS
jgi:hypothetical protein